MKKIKTLIMSEGFRYLFFGGLATIVYTAAKFLSYQALQSGWLSEVIAQSTAIIFAFFTNKWFVFQHKSDQVWKDFIGFVLGRLALLLFAIAMNAWLVDAHPEILMNAFGISKNTMVVALNLFLQVFTIFVNYLYSKFVIFRKKAN
ncbi:MAG: GtrA family protein [Streptococcaceae bacterium]|jgi:putative flippase GtrA|nr:GtrA family protein [Streptococcaceae bacterium]